MAVLFSAVTLTAGNNQAEFLAAGIPRDTDDLEGWTAYENFMDASAAWTTERNTVPNPSQWTSKPSKEPS